MDLRGDQLKVASTFCHVHILYRSCSRASSARVSYRCPPGASQRCPATAAPPRGAPAREEMSATTRSMNKLIASPLAQIKPSEPSLANIDLILTQVGQVASFCYRICAERGNPGRNPSAWGSVLSNLGQTPKNPGGLV